MSKKRVLLLTNHDDDVYCFRKELIEGMIEAGYEVYVSCPNGPKLALMKDIDYKFIDITIDRRGTNIVKDFKLFLTYCGMIKKIKPDVVLGYTAKPNIYGSVAAHLFGIPTINNITGLGSVGENKGFIQKLTMTMFKFAFRKSACIFFQNSENMKTAKALGMIKGYHELIPGSGVDTDRFPALEYPDDEKIVFNYIGRVLKDKGVDDYIELAKRIKKKYPSTEFNIIGFIEPTEIHYQAELEGLEKQGIVYYRGSQNDVKPFIKRSHCTIHPSRYGEGMSNVLLESASSARPIITTNMPGCREVVKEGINGYIYQPGNVDELEKAVDKFMSLDNGQRKHMGEEGRNYVKDNFSRKKVVEAYLRRIKDING